ncbi:ISL3 family transposase [Streptococcus agalactiae]|nr:ISL3 family transposase [Streptococcus agalactiae]
MNNILEATLQIKDKNIIWDNKVQEKIFKKRKSLFYSATYTHKPEFCTVCGCVSQNNNIVKNGTKTSRITLCSVSGLPAYLNLRKQRFLCRECGSSFTADTSRIVEKHCHISKRLKNEIKSKISETVSETYIAKETNVSVHTVRRIIDDTARLLTIKPLHDLPEHLCFDEFKSVKSSDSNMSFIICDSTTHKLVDVVRDRKSYSLKQYFYRFEPKTRLKVKTISIDMYVPYIQLIKEMFPNAKIIIDPFHIVQALNRELNRTRVRVMNQHRYKLFESFMTTQGIVDYILENNPSLKHDYEVVHSLRECIQDRDYIEFKETIEAATQLDLSPGLKRVLKTLMTYLPYIQNTCEYPTRTNGPIEGINNKIKVLKRNAYGFKNYYHFRNRIILITKMFGPKQKGIKQQLVA